MACSCVPSLQPLFSPGDAIDDPGILGTWREEKNGRTWVVGRGEKGGLAIACTEDGETRNLLGTLGRIGGDVFLDLYPDGDLNLKNSIFGGHFMPVHVFYRITRTGNDLSAWGLEGDFEKKLVAAGKTRIAQISEGIPVLTGSSAELREFIRVHAREKGFLAEAVEMRRVQ